MKQLIAIILLITLFYSCDKNNDEISNNKIVLLKVDFLTNTFEGGKELRFSEAPSFSISAKYKAPGDFGSVALYYKELDEKIFEGTIIWMGTGKMSYPSKIDPQSKFSKTSSKVLMPNINLFEKVMYVENAYYPEGTNYENIWNSISNLRIVSNYRETNPNGKVQLFLYTPSVGVGNPADWDWFVILKN